MAQDGIAGENLHALGLFCVRFNYGLGQVRHKPYSKIASHAESQLWSEREELRISL